MFNVIDMLCVDWQT